MRFHFYNRDGTRATMCGNGALCAARLAVALELASPERIFLVTDSGAVRASAVDPVRAQIELPSAAAVSQPEVELQAGELDLSLTRVGVPHLVVRVENVVNVPVESR